MFKHRKVRVLLLSFLNTYISGGWLLAVAMADPRGSLASERAALLPRHRGHGSDQSPTGPDGAPAAANRVCGLACCSPTLLGAVVAVAVLVTVSPLAPPLA